MIAQARFTALSVSGKKDISRLSSRTLYLPEHGGFPPCQDGMCARSGRAADVVRERSNRLARAGDACCAPAAATFCVTPARWEPRDWRRQIGGSEWVRGGCERNHSATAGATPKPLFSFAFAAGCAGCVRSPRVMRACLRARTRAHIREGIGATAQPTYLILVYQEDSGCRSVADRLRWQPALVDAPAGGGAPLHLHILAGGNASRPSGWAVQVGSSSVARGSGGESFGDFAPGAGGLVGLELADLAGAQLLDGNGGFLRLSALPLGRVGTAMLEGWPRGHGNAPFVARRRKPVRLRGSVDLGEAGGLPVGRRTPPCPHRGAAIPPARWRATWSAFGSSPPAATDRLRRSSLQGQWSAIARWRQRLIRWSGRGRGVTGSGGDTRLEGQGTTGLAGGRHRRSADGRPGGANVN